MESQTVNMAILKERLNFAELIENGDFFLHREMVAEASYAYKEAARISNNTLAKEKLGNLAFFKCNYEEAEKYFQECKARRGWNTVSCKMAHTKMKQKKYAEAIKMFEVSLKKDPNSRGQYLNLIGQCKFG